MLKAGTCLEIKIIHRIRMLNLSLKELELQEKNRGIKEYKSMSMDKLWKILNKPKPVKNLYRLEKDKGTKDRALGGIRNLYRLEKGKLINDRALRDIRTMH